MEEAFPGEGKLGKEILDKEVTTTVWHGTRRVESDEELKQKGFCTYEPGQVGEWLNEAFELFKSKTKVGPRREKYLEDRKRQVSKEAYEDWRRQVSVSGIEEASCGWGFRNPELVHDWLWFATSGPLFNEILTELFGEPRKIEIRTKVKIQQLFNPQDIHLPKLCIKPEEIVSIEPCHIQAEEMSHFRRMGKTSQVPIESIAMTKTPVESEVEEKMRLIIAKKLIRPPILTRSESGFLVYGRQWSDSNATVEAYRRLGYTKVPAKIAELSSYLPEEVPDV